MMRQEGPSCPIQSNPNFGRDFEPNIYVLMYLYIYINVFTCAHIYSCSYVCKLVREKREDRAELKRRDRARKEAESFNTANGTSSAWPAKNGTMARDLGCLPERCERRQSSPREPLAAANRLPTACEQAPRCQSPAKPWVPLTTTTVIF